MTSISKRLVLGTVAALLICVMLMGVYLERSLKKTLSVAQNEKLKGVVYALLGAMEISPSGQVTLDQPERVDTRLTQLDSDLWASIQSLDGPDVWLSPSYLPVSDQLTSTPKVGVWLFESQLGEKSRAGFFAAYSIEWISEKGSHRSSWTITVWESAESYFRQLGLFRTSLWYSLGIVGALLLCIQLAVLRWGLNPLKLFSRELKTIQEGKAEQIESPSPVELNEVRNGLNALLRHERSQQKRFRNALSDLAHSLKTPLAVLRSSNESGIQTEVDRMDKMIRYQVQRAATAGRAAFAQPVSVGQIVSQLSDAMRKVHRSKTIDIEQAIDPLLTLRMDEGDLMELLGNLMDNACKWCRSKVRVTAEREPRFVTLYVDDDGPGFPSQTDLLFQRGVRADEKVDGQGIGLAVVHEMVTVYEGILTLDKSPLGGARVRIQLVN